MSAQHPSRTYKGCGLCKPHKRRGLGDGQKFPTAVVRRLGGRRALKRKELEA